MKVIDLIESINQITKDNHQIIIILLMSYPLIICFLIIIRLFMLPNGKKRYSHLMPNSDFYEGHGTFKITCRMFVQVTILKYLSIHKMGDFYQCCIKKNIIGKSDDSITMVYGSTCLRRQRTMV